MCATRPLCGRDVPLLCDADRRLVRLGERRDEVLAPQLQAVHAQLVGQLLDRHLDQMRRLQFAPGIAFKTQCRKQ